MATPDVNIQPDEGNVVVNQTFEGQPGFGELAPLVPAVVKETKAGYKTTEFWVAIATSLLVWLDTVPLPEKFEGVVVGAIGLVYILSRGIAKQGVPSVEEPAK